MSNSTSVKVPDEIKVQMQMHAYLDRAIGYYIFARKAVMLGVVPVGGSMFHIAVEMILHCGLSAKYPQAELERKFAKHELPYMWAEFKALYAQSKLSRFDGLVNHHRQWKELRYPKANSEGSAIFFGRTKPDPELMKKNISNLPGSKVHLEINLEEMDEYMTSIIQTINIDPNNIKISLQRSEELMELYLQENRHPLFDRSQVSSATFFKK